MLSTNICPTHAQSIANSLHFLNKDVKSLLIDIRKIQIDLRIQKISFPMKQILLSSFHYF